MKKFIALLLIFLLAGCSHDTPATETEPTMTPMVMVDGVLYLDTGFNNNIAKCGVPDGEITSSVDGSKKPFEDNQSNFGTGYEYQYGTEGTIEINMDGKWRIFATDAVRQKMQFPGNEVPLFKEAPALTVIYGDETLTALKGTNSWRYSNGDGTQTCIEADSMHPLQSKEYMPSLNLLPSIRSSVEPLRAYLEWEVMPDDISVRCRSAAHWGKSESQSEEIPVSILMFDSEPPTASLATIKLKDGDYVYEVSAKWNRFENWGGSAHYSFYTVKPNMEPKPLD